MDIRILTKIFKYSDSSKSLDFSKTLRET